MSKLDNKIILVTGASRGIGAEVAKYLAAQGAKLILCARDIAGLEAVDDVIQQTTGEPATIMPLDLADHEKIDAIGPAILQKYGKLDGFIGNAAILGQVTPLTHHDPKLFQKVMDVNVTANYRLLRILHPLLMLSDAPRVAFVTSGVTQMTLTFFGAYAASKAALETLALHYASEHRDTKLRVNLIDPGIVATGMRASAFPGEDKSKLRQASHPGLMRLFETAMSPDCLQQAQRFHL